MIAALTSGVQAGFRRILSPRFAGGQETGLDTVLDLVGKKDVDVFAKVASAIGNTDADAKVLHLKNKENQFDVTVVKGEGGKAVFWFDFREVAGNVWEKFATRFSLPGFRTEDPDNLKINHEAPTIDDDNMQMTAYYLQPDDSKQSVSTQTVHVYVGDNFLITTRPAVNPSIDRVKKLFSESARYKTPQELMGVVMRDIINHDRRIIESLSEDYQELSDKVDAKTTSKVLNEIKVVGDTINTINRSIIRQRGVFSDLLEINEFKESKLVKHSEIEGFLKRIDQNLSFLSAHRQHLDSLIQVFRAKEGSELEKRMKRLGTIGLVGIPLTFIPGLMGMNVPIPFATHPNTFTAVAAGSVALAGVLYLAVKKLVR